MQLEEVMLAVYEAAKSSSDEKDILRNFLYLERERGMTGINRATHEAMWADAVKYPAAFKLKILTARQDTLRKELCDAMLRHDPAWEDVITWAELVQGAQQSPAGLRPALTALREAGYREAADELTSRAMELFPKQFTTE